MRIGQNPAKFVKNVTRPARVTVAILNYIPFLSGFYNDMPDVLNACLGSLRENTGMEFDLMVFDNGSCSEVKDNLVARLKGGEIQYLYLSEKNLGKGGAWNSILSGAPGELISYSDNDCYFMKGWLEKSLEILEKFPRVGMVTARPFRTNPEFYTSTANWGDSTPDAVVERGNFIPYNVFQEFDRSLGQTDEEIKHHYETTEDVRLTYGGVNAIAGASHWQFLAQKDVLAEFLPFSMDRPMGQVKQLDSRINAAGYLRLMPTEPLVMNMSNTLRNMAGLASAVQKQNKGAAGQRLLDFPPVRKGLMAIYDRIFRWYYDR